MRWGEDRARMSEIRSKRAKTNRKTDSHFQKVIEQLSNSHRALAEKNVAKQYTYKQKVVKQYT